MSDESKLTISGVVDRVEGDHAVVLVGQEQAEIIVPVSQLPKGAGEGSWLKLGFDLASIELDPTAQAKTEQRVKDKMERLRNRGRRLPRSD